MIIDTKRVRDALLYDRAEHVAEKFNLSVSQIRKYRQNKHAKGFVDWRTMPLKKAAEIIAILDDEDRYFVGEWRSAQLKGSTIERHKQITQLIEEFYDIDPDDMDDVYDYVTSIAGATIRDAENCYISKQQIIPAKKYVGDKMPTGGEPDNGLEMIVFIGEVDEINVVLTFDMQTSLDIDD